MYHMKLMFVVCHHLYKVIEKFLSNDLDSLQTNL